MLAKLKFRIIIIIIIGYIPSKIFYGSLMYVSYFCPEVYKESKFMSVCTVCTCTHV